MHLEKMAFDYIDVVSSTADIESLNWHVNAFLQNVGGDYFVGAQIVFPGGALRPTNLLGNYRHDWLDFYRKNHLLLDDPAAYHMRWGPQPFTWSWLGKNLDLTASQQMVMNEPRNFGLSEGLVLPIYGPKGAIAGFSVAGEFFRPGSREVAAIQMVLSAAYNHALHITKLFEAVSPAKLTKRQRECLNWVQHGKSNQDIAAILGISAGTVKDHIDAAKKAFDVGSRIEAVMAAHRENLLGF